MFRRELTLFFIAMGFFTRIPMPAWVQVDSENLNKANRYFGLVGILVGGLSAAVYALAVNWLPTSVAIIFAMITSAIATGGFHEDGLADTTDGFGGGWTVADKLLIMKDSRLGSYGALALVFILLLKWQILNEMAAIDINMVSVALIVGHCLSRVFAASFIFSEQYVSDSDTSKSKPLAQNQSMNELLISLMTALTILMLLSLSQALLLIGALLLLRWGLVVAFRRQIGGYTGDTLGAGQQISEMLCYLTILVLVSSL
ncbi:adenosylcobinamide-GDP ribazoletransferase [Shewanella atlantica]|uniref:Adenosylcobinamide-GDP ribazoletransferase n=1 Tax=Shewanella atlantica TaxID=271099 RepID=A0A3S0KDV6_9GAMM|nr:adenosylcobinamide-GDP ribazoletransferase [Shewanella atlantica]RTR28578.1 adenosylcobinamide-GDP ribazoletransferase [Shewanella atlantica]